MDTDFIAAAEDIVSRQPIAAAIVALLLGFIVGSTML